MNNLKKSWKTTMIGFLIIGYYLYNFVVNDVQIDFASVVSLLIGVGFLFSKDADKSHSIGRIQHKTGGSIGDPDPDIRP